MSVKEDDDFYHILPPEIWEMVAPYAEARTMMSLKLTCKLAVVCHPDWHLPYPPALLRYSWANDGIRKIALCAFMRQRLFLVDGMRGAGVGLGTHRKENTAIKCLEVVTLRVPCGANRWIRLWHAAPHWAIFGSELIAWPDDLNDAISALSPGILDPSMPHHILRVVQERQTFDVAEWRPNDLAVRAQVDALRRQAAPLAEKLIRLGRQRAELAKSQIKFKMDIRGLAVMAQAPADAQQESLANSELARVKCALQATVSELAATEVTLKELDAKHEPLVDACAELMITEHVARRRRENEYHREYQHDLLWRFLRDRHILFQYEHSTRDGIHAITELPLSAEDGRDVERYLSQEQVRLATGTLPPLDAGDEEPESTAHGEGSSGDMGWDLFG
jgi:hypothetical protein